MRTDFVNHQRVRGFSEATIRRRIWSLKQLAAVGPLDTHDADSIEAFLLRWPSPSTRRAVLSDLSAFYGWAVRRGHLTYNPAAEVDRPRVPSRDATPLSAGDLRRVLEVANVDQRRAIMLGAWAGLRCAEIAALDASDVHRDLGVLVVRNGKGGKDGVVPLAVELAAVLPLTGKVVRYPSGAAVGRAMRRAFTKAGVVARPHDTRHSFGTALASRSGGNMPLVARLMRHESYQTSQRYVRWSGDGAEMVSGLHAA